MDRCGKKSKFAMLLLLVAGSVWADDEVTDSEFPDEFFVGDVISFRAGVYEINSRTTVRIDSADGNIGTTINLENDLNLDDEKSTRYLALSWRVKGGHLIELENFSLNRSGLQTLEAILEVGDEVYEIGALLDSYFETDVTRLGYAYIFRENDTFAYAVSAGLHLTKLKMGITEFGPNQMSVEDLQVAEITAPLPVIGFSFGWNFSQKWYLYARGQVFRLEVGDYKGRLDHLSAKMEYNAFENVGFGIGYDFFDINLKADDEKWHGRVDYNFRGPLLFVKVMF